MKRLVVWHDGACPLCRREIAWIRWLDRGGAIRFVNAAASAEQDFPIDRRELLARFHASEDGQLLSGAAAFAAIWRAIPALRPLGLVARSPRMLSLLEHVYRAFLKVRPALQRLVRTAAPG